MEKVLRTEPRGSLSIVPVISPEERSGREKGGVTSLEERQRGHLGLGTKEVDTERPGRVKTFVSCPS